MRKKEEKVGDAAIYQDEEVIREGGIRKCKSQEFDLGHRDMDKLGGDQGEMPNLEPKEKVRVQVSGTQ